jgi:hypothetical protein
MPSECLRNATGDLGSLAIAATAHGAYGQVH